MLIKSIVVDRPRGSEFDGGHMRGFLVAVQCVALQALIEHAFVNQRYTGVGEFIHELILPTTFLPGR